MNFVKMRGSPVMMNLCMKLRYIAYSRYSRNLAENIEKDYLLACAVLAIRTKFPAQSGDYTEFKFA